MSETNKPSAEQLAKYKQRANDMSLSEDVRAKFRAIVEKFESAVEGEPAKPAKAPRKPRATKEKTPAKRGRKPASTSESKADAYEKAKADLKKKTGKTEEECESIIEQYRELRAKAQTRKAKEEEASKENKKRVEKLERKGDIIEGTNEKTADAVIETATQEVADKIEKQIEAVEQKAEKEAKAEVAKDKTLKTPKAKKEAVEAKVEKKVAEKTKTIVKRVVIDTSALLISISESLGKFDKDSQKEFLIKLRSDIDKMLAKFAFGGMTDGAVQPMNIQQSNLSASSVNPTLFRKGGGVRSYKKGGRMFGEDARLEYVDDAFASEDLKDELKEKLGIKTNSLGDNVVISFAYTDYGGDFLDKVAIRYFEENYPENIIVENAGYNGQNAYVFGEPAQEWIESTDDYPLGMSGLEDLYYEMQNESEDESFSMFLDDLERDDYVFDRDEVMEWLIDNRGGYYTMTTQGLDFSYSDLTNSLINEGLIYIEEDEEEYEKRGQIGKELMGGQSDATKKPSGAILLKVIGNGREIIVTEDGGKTKERYVRRKGGFSGYALYYNGDQYEFTDSFAKGGLTEHGLKIGDRIEKKIDSNGEIIRVKNKKENAFVMLDKGHRMRIGEFSKMAKGGGIGSMLRNRRGK